MTSDRLPSLNRSWHAGLGLGVVVISRIVFVAVVAIAELLLLWLMEHVAIWIGLTQVDIYPAAHFVAAWLLVLFDIALLATVAVKCVHDVVDHMLSARSPRD
ncbi:MAG: hypothetical protein J2P45_11270 [Candidatus Dormibacteraeota bacterium]|nr:hypothetical protein [Candidatus Dormibacteraeota bacterium]